MEETKTAQPEVTERKITKAASIETEVQTGKFKETESKVKADVSSLDAFVLNEDVQLHKSEDAAYYTGSYTIKVEHGKYDSLVARLKERFQNCSNSANLLRILHSSILTLKLSLKSRRKGWKDTGHCMLK